MSTLVEGNRLSLLASGVEYFPALEAAIDDARAHIHLQTYIFADDPAGRRIAAALVRAVMRGVSVAIVVDGFGSRHYLGTLADEMLGAGIEVYVFRPEIAGFNFDRQRLRRMHRKLAVIDARIAFVGGINIIDDMHTPNHTPPREDYAVQIDGPLALEVWRHARQLWSALSWTLRSDGPPTIPMEPASTSPGHQRAAVLVRDNFRHRSDIEDAYLAAIEGATDEIFIASAYFFPGRRFRRALAQAAGRGVRVVLLLQGRVEYVLLHYASRALYGSLLDAGIQIHEYHKSFLHAKVAVIDQRWATVGSSNIDPFSLLLAREANVVVDDRRFANELRESLIGRMNQGAVPLARQRWRRRPLHQRMLIWMAYGFARFLIGMYGYGGRH